MNFLLTLLAASASLVTSQQCKYRVAFQDGEFIENPTTECVANVGTAVDGDALGGVITETIGFFIVDYFTASFPDNNCAVQEIQRDRFFSGCDEQSDLEIPSNFFFSRDITEVLLECDCGSFGGGEPHIKPWISPRYYFHGECDSILLASGLMDIHIRTTIKDIYSIISATAIRVGNSVLEMSMGNTGIFWINGEEVTDDDLPLQFDGKYFFDKVETINDGVGAVYALHVENMLVNIRVMKFIMAVELQGDDPSFREGTSGLTGKYPVGELLGRDGVTLYAPDRMQETHKGDMEAVYNTFGQEWQVRDTDPQLFREPHAPVWPEKCNFPEESSAQTKRRFLRSSVGIEAASKACASRHEEGSKNFDFCVTDVLLLDDVDAAYSW